MILYSQLKDQNILQRMWNMNKCHEISNKDKLNTYE